LEELSQQDAELNICKLKKEEAQSLIEKYDIAELPSTLIFKAHEFMEKAEGYMESDDLEDIIENYK
jgi:hypothetical protein